MHCPALIQVICSELLKTWGQKGFESHVAQVQNFYKDQRNKMLKAAETHLTGLGKFIGEIYRHKFKGSSDPSHSFLKLMSERGGSNIERL